MFSLDDRPALPETPAFRAGMEQFLVSAARSEPRRSRPTRRPLIAAAAGAAVVGVAIGAAVFSNGTSGAPGRVEVGPVHVHLAGFSVDTNPGGTVTVTLSDVGLEGDCRPRLTPLTHVECAALLVAERRPFCCWSIAPEPECADASDGVRRRLRLGERGSLFDDGGDCLWFCGPAEQVPLAPITT
jgi:hypothetical protein